MKASRSYLKDLLSKILKTNGSRLLLDLGHKRYSSIKDLLDSLNAQLSTFENRYGIFSKSTSYGLRFINLIDTIYSSTKSRVVILIDNYDKPIMDSLFSSEIKNEIKSILQSF